MALTGEPAWVKGNTQRLEQVVINLLLNACQAVQTRDKGIAIRTSCEEKKEIVIEVRDEGQGITPENLKKIREPFVTTKQSIGGTRLGLYVSRTIVAEHGGSLTFASEPGKGTLAVIRLPLDLPHETSPDE